MLPAGLVEVEVPEMLRATASQVSQLGRALFIWVAPGPVRA